MPAATAFWRRKGISPMATGHPAVFGTPAGSLLLAVSGLPASPECFGMSLH